MANTVQKESKVVYLQIGQNYEHLAETKQFDVSEWVEAYPEATIYILFRRPGEDVVAPVQTTLEDGILTWTISNWETGIIGVGFAEIRAIDSTAGLVKKSHVIPCSVEASVTDEDTAPDFPSWVDRMITMNEHLESVYTDFNQELTDGMAAIQDEAAEQKADAVAAIQSKGDTVIASIPMSYTDLIAALAGAAYNPNRHYEHDEFVWYDNALWQRVTDSPSIVGPWNENDWTRAALTAHVTEALWQVESMQREIYNSIAPAWDYYDATASYAVGDYVINREKLYRCIFPVSGGGDFDYSKWEVVTVATELQNYVQSNAIAPEYSASSAYTAGQCVWYSGNVYRCKTDISTAEAWTAAHWQLVKIGDELTSLKSAVDYTSDIIETFGRRYIDFEQGTISSSGAEVDNSAWVRTGFIPVETILALKKPLGIQMGHFYYDGNKTFIESGSSSQIIPDESSYEFIRSMHPTAKYIRYRLRMYDGTTALTTTPDKILESDFNLIITNASDGFFSIENQILTKSMTIYVPVSCESPKNMIIEIRSKFTGTQPTIQAIRSWLGSDNKMHQYYNSALFPVGGENYITQRIRIAPSPITSGITKISITVPTESTLDILYVRNSYSDMRCVSDFGINLNGHGKYGCGAPDNVCASYELASKMGYKYCITIPKVTSDGVLVCLHDDDSIQSTARNDDGTQIATEYQNRAVSTFTYQELLQFDFGISRGIPFKGERIPLLEDFFKICAKTGMHPMLSCHPSLSGHWAEIRALAVKYNLLDKLNIKCDQSNITVMMDALGGDIESYTIDESSGVDRAERMVTLINRYNIDTAKCRCGVEYINTITDALITSALNAGLFVGFYGYGTNASRVKELIEKGVTEFTDDYIASVGLNW